MHQYEITVTYSILDSSSNSTNKTLLYIVTANSLEEARTLTQEAAMIYINKANGTFVSVE